MKQSFAKRHTHSVSEGYGDEISPAKISVGNLIIEDGFLYMQSPNSTVFKILVDNFGNLITEEVL